MALQSYDQLMGNAKSPTSQGSATKPVVNNKDPRLAALKRLQPSTPQDENVTKRKDGGY